MILTSTYTGDQVLSYRSVDQKTEIFEISFSIFLKLWIIHLSVLFSADAGKKLQTNVAKP